MDSVNLEALKTDVRWLEQRQRVLLVTMIKTWGSSSRPEGTMLALRNDGVVIGSVSDSCIEDGFIDRIRREGLHYTKSEAVKYGVSAEEAHRFGLPCGGTLQLILESLSTSSRIDALLRVAEAGQLVARTPDMTTDAATLQHATVTDGLQFDEARPATIHGPRYRILVTGAGQLPRYLYQIAVGLDYQITVCDPREKYSKEWSIPGATMVRTMPDDTAMAMKLDERCTVIAPTHDPKLNDLALVEAFETPAFYVGAFGSRRNNTNRRERLKEFDLSDTELARLHGSVGIYISSRTSPEIAVSVLVEVTAAENGVSLPTILQVEDAKATRETTANATPSCAVPQS